MLFIKTVYSHCPKTSITGEKVSTGYKHIYNWASLKLAQSREDQALTRSTIIVQGRALS